MSKVILVALGIITIASFSSMNAQTNYDDVLVVINSQSRASDSIGVYFAQQRHIPQINIVRINVPAREEIDSATFATLRTQIESHLISNSLTQTINYIVTTKGVPLKVNRGNTFSTTSSSSSIESELTLILGANSSAIGQNGMIMSPYFYKSEHFSHKTFGMYLVTRLDGYTVSDVKALIDRSAQPVFVSSSTTFVFDQDPAWNSSLPALNNELKKAASLLNERGLTTKIDTTSIYLTKQDDVIGYASWGSNDHYANQYTQFAKPNNKWASGAIAETYVSTSGRTFSSPVSYGQSVIADLVAEGITGIKGYVYEPYSPSMSMVSILFERYTNGYNLAESFFMASRYLSWMDVVVGDPKMQIYTKKTIMTNISGTANALTGTTSVSWSTIVEYKNLGFQIDRTKIVNAKQLGNWTTIGFVPGNGTSLKGKGYSFNDNEVKPGSYYYRIRQIDSSKATICSDSVEVTVSKAIKPLSNLTKIATYGVANDFSQLTNYPNPFNPETEVRFKTAEAGMVTLIVYNSIGQEVEQLINEEMSSGDHTVNFNGNNLSSGVYFIRLQTSIGIQTQKMILQK